MKQFKKLFIPFLLFTAFSIQAQKIIVVPQPNEMTVDSGSFKINSRIKILYSKNGLESAKILQKYLSSKIGTGIKISKSEKFETGTIYLKSDTSFAKEQYRLEINSDGVQIIASNNVGWFYGLQTIYQLFPSISAPAERTNSIELPLLKINDKPRFSWRCFMLDEARYFKGKEQIKLLLDEMALLKMNIFHWHLVDDDGWRIEIKKYPLLTRIGSTRKSSQIGSLKWASPIQSGETVSGFYTQKDIKEIVKYASERNITVIPEIEMPGHSVSAIAAYPWLGTKKKPLEMPTQFFSRKDIYDVSDPRFYQFITDVLDEIIELFPSKVIHIGGDEVQQTIWKESPTVQTYMKDNNLATTGELQMFFINKVSKYLESKGRRMMGWNEILGQNIHGFLSEADTRSNLKLSKASVVHFWKGDVDLAKKALNEGYDIVNSLNTYTYLDYDYKALPLSKAYEFDPMPPGIDPKYFSKVMGLECHMWGEWIPTKGEMHFLTFPRIAAYAEVGWTEMKNKDFQRFKSGLSKLQKHWSEKNIYFATDEAMEQMIKDK
jgi:hexosaminidase